jgi:hypothetical protein
VRSSFFKYSWLSVPFGEAVGIAAPMRMSGELLHHPTVERHHIQIVAAGEVDAFLIECEMRIRFRIDGFGELPPRVLCVIVDEDVTFVGEHGHRLVFR